MPEPTSESRVAKAANLFDLRRIIGALFVAYVGLVVMAYLLRRPQRRTPDPRQA